MRADPVALDPDTERQVWQQFVESEGWRLFHQSLQKVWHSREVLRKITEAYGKQSSAEAQADHVRRWIVGKEIVDDILGLPYARIAQLNKPMPAEPVTSRRGGD